MRKILLFLICLILFCTTHAQSQTYNSDSTSYPKITKIETNLYNKAYEQDDIDTRLDRIEMSIFSKTYPQKSLSARVDAIGDKLELNQYFNISKSDLTDIEQEVFSKSFPKEDSIKRLERLEAKVFGAVQSGDPEKRMKLLAKASKNYSSNNFFANESGDTQDDSSQQDYPTYTSPENATTPYNAKQSQNYPSQKDFELFSSQSQEEFESDNNNPNTSQASTGNRALDFVQAYLLPIVTGLLGGGSNYYNNNYPYGYNNPYSYNNPYAYNNPNNYYRANPNYTCSPSYMNTLFNNMGTRVRVLN